MNHAFEAEQAVVDHDAILLLRDAIDGPVEHPVEQDARRPATQPRVVLGRPHAKRIGLRFAARCELHRPRIPARRRNVLRREFPVVYRADQALRRHDAAAARRHGDHVLLLRPVAGDVRLPSRLSRRPARQIDFRGHFELRVAVQARAVADLDVLEVARARIVAVAEAEHRSLCADREHLGRPPGAAQQRGRAHLAVHGDLSARGVHDVEVQIRMRVHEVDASDHARERHLLRAIEPAETVMRGRRGGRSERGGREQSSSERIHGELQKIFGQSFRYAASARQRPFTLS